MNINGRSLCLHDAFDVGLSELEIILSQETTAKEAR